MDEINDKAFVTVLRHVTVTRSASGLAGLAVRDCRGTGDEDAVGGQR